MILSKMDKELRRILTSLKWPLIFLVVMWLVFVLQNIFNLDLAFLGVHPLHADGLLGIITGVFIHGNLGHIFSNSFPFLILGWALFYFYQEFAFKSLIMMWLTTGIWVWFFARTNYHIGASGLIYAMASFHIVSALIRKVFGLMAFAMLVIFLYGSMVWGFFPELFPKENISWESHIMGAIAGIVFAFYFRKQGVQKPSLEDEFDDEFDENDDEDLSPYHTHIKYYYTDNKDNTIDD